ncbi:hypothetical protein B9Z55_011011 [Caenorhabditis nigoni]|uniref:Uncharacterized protein n=1 Tax=Caenorhabditis nigoni TaxID=1611254 RepID=A0A2G5UID7_9PELO|nr:hypothetical protein B9Z55_011011 [Caenorhabditis nigoni]
MAPVPVDLSKIDYAQLLKKSQSGNGPYVGMRYQRGGGLGGILSAALTMLPQFMNSSAGQHLMSAGKHLTSELVQGNDLKSSLKHVASRKMRELSGSGRKRIKGPSVKVLKPHFVNKTRVNFLPAP